ncbi:DNA repair protein xrcc3 [Rhizophlyctis rosea]|nr:DNA repair protein xrcc3 [Rhizophlyctis rosea]
MNVDELEFPFWILNKLHKARLETVEQVVLLSASDLATKLRVDEQSASEILLEVSAAVFQIPKTVISASILHQNQARRLTLGDLLLDSVLDGGILAGAITEVYGRSAAGKTQLALQLSITGQLPVEEGGFGGGVAYIATEQKFPIQRYTQLLAHFQTRYPCLNPEVCLNNLHILHVKDLETQHHILCYQLPALIKLHKVRTVLIDSIAANFRGEESTTTSTVNAAQIRGKDLYEIIRCLKEVGTEKGVAIVCLNQVSDVIGDPEAVATAGMTQARQAFLEVKGREDLADGEVERVKPSLGLQWSNLVNVQLMLSRKDTVIGLPVLEGALEGSTYSMKTVRTLRVGFAPHLPRRQCRFTITAEGIVGVPDP